MDRIIKRRFLQKEGKYLAGYVVIYGKKHPVTVFSNKFKEKETQPEFIIYETF
jgi:hypothetical protein